MPSMRILPGGPARYRLPLRRSENLALALRKGVRSWRDFEMAESANGEKQQTGSRSGGSVRRLTGQPRVPIRPARSNANRQAG
jgi:hypothetical protein